MSQFFLSSFFLSDLFFLFKWYCKKKTDQGEEEKAFGGEANCLGLKRAIARLARVTDWIEKEIVCCSQVCLCLSMLLPNMFNPLYLSFFPPNRREELLLYALRWKQQDS